MKWPIRRIHTKWTHDEPHTLQGGRAAFAHERGADYQFEKPFGDIAFTRFRQA